MALSVTCPSCNKQFRVGEDFLAREVACPSCGKASIASGPILPPFDAFVSYSSKDKTVADAVVATLEADGVRCWVAPRDIVPGTEWSESIIGGINQSRMVVLVFSASSNASQQVLREVERAVNRGLPVVPFRIENLLPSRGMEYFISASHWLDAYHPPLDSHLAKLSQTTKSLLHGLAPSETPPANLKNRVRAAARTLTARDNRVRVLAGLLGLVFLIGALTFAAIYAMRPKGAPPAPPELVQAKADAEVQAEKIKLIEPGQGLGAKRDEIDNHLKSGQTLFAQGDFDQAGQHFRAIIHLGPPLLAAETNRQDARAARAEADRAMAESAAAGSKDLVPELWLATSEQVTIAEREFEAGNFTAARDRWKDSTAAYRAVRENAGLAKSVGEARAAFEKERDRHGIETLKEDDGAGWNRLLERVGTAEAAYKSGRFADATKGYRDAEAVTRKLATPRLKYLAHEAGELARQVFALKTRHSGGGLSAPPFGRVRPAPGAAAGVPGVNDEIARQRYAPFLLRLQSPHLDVLGLPDQFVQKLDESPSGPALIDLVRSPFKQLKEKWGEEVASCYTAGKDLADALGPIISDDTIGGRTWASGLEKIASDLVGAREFMVKGGYPAFALARLDRCKEVCANASQAGPSEGLKEARTAIWILGDLLRHSRLDYQRPLQRRYSIAQGASLFRFTPPVAGSVEAMILDKGGLYFPDCSDATRPTTVVEFRTGSLDAADVARLKELKSLRVLVLSAEFPVAGGKSIREMPNVEVLEVWSKGSNELLDSLKGSNIRELDLKYSKEVTDAGMIYLTGLPKLERLNLEYTQITGAGLAEHLKDLPSFKELVVEGNPALGGLGYRVKEAEIGRLRKARPDVKIVYGTR